MPDHTIDLTHRDVYVLSNSRIMQSINCKDFQYINLNNFYIKMLDCNPNLVAAFLKYLEHMKPKAFNHCQKQLGRETPEANELLSEVT